MLYNEVSNTARQNSFRLISCSRFKPSEAKSRCIRLPTSPETFLNHLNILHEGLALTLEPVKSITHPQRTIYRSLSIVSLQNRDRVLSCSEWLFFGLESRLKSSDRCQWGLMSHLHLQGIMDQSRTPQTNCRIRAKDLRLQHHNGSEKSEQQYQHPTRFAILLASLGSWRHRRDMSRNFRSAPKLPSQEGMGTIEAGSTKMAATREPQIATD